LNGAGVATAVSYTLTQQTASATGATPTASASATPTAGGNPVTMNPHMRKHHAQNLSGM
jgi:hypothetical protein